MSTTSAGSSCIRLTSKRQRATSGLDGETEVGNAFVHVSAQLEAILNNYQMMS